MVVVERVEWVLNYEFTTVGERLTKNRNVLSQLLNFGLSELLQLADGFLVAFSWQSRNFLFSSSRCNNWLFEAFNASDFEHIHYHSMDVDMEAVVEGVTESFFHWFPYMGWWCLSQHLLVKAQGGRVKLLVQLIEIFTFFSSWDVAKCSAFTQDLLHADAVVVVVAHMGVPDVIDLLGWVHHLV